MRDIYLASRSGNVAAMPLPRSVARFNKRVTNRFIEPLVARTSTFAIVEHVGRRSGRVYRTPINLFPCGDRYVAALTYGPEVDWVRNVAAGPAGAELAGERYRIEDVQRAERGAIWHCLPRLTKPALRMLRVHHFLTLSLAEVDTSL